MRRKAVCLILVLIMILTSVGTFYASPGGGYGGDGSDRPITGNSIIIVDVDSCN